MLERKTLWLSALAAALLAFFVSKGDRVTQIMGGVTAFLGTLGLDGIALVVGIVCTILSLIFSTFLNWHFKNKRHNLLREHLASGDSIESFLDRED